MIPNPILRVLSTLSSHEVRHLLMGGQACVFYGAAEFSRDCDIVILADQENLARLTSAIEDLVRAKKTQREKDWPMVRRLVDSHYDEFRDDPTDDRIRFWLRESRTPEVLISVAASNPELLKEMLAERPLLVETMSASRTALRQELDKEKLAVMEADAPYWRPLMKELEAMRLNKRRGGTR